MHNDESPEIPRATGRMVSREHPGKPKVTDGAGSRTENVKCVYNATHHGFTSRVVAPDGTRVSLFAYVLTGVTFGPTGSPKPSIDQPNQIDDAIWPIVTSDYAKDISMIVEVYGYKTGPQPGGMLVAGCYNEQWNWWAWAVVGGVGLDACNFWHMNGQYWGSTDDWGTIDCVHDGHLTARLQFGSGHDWGYQCGFRRFR